MAKNQYEIDLDYRLTMEQVAELEEIADDLRKLGNQSLEEMMQQIGNSWSGDNARKFLTKGQKLGEEITGIAEKIRKIAEGMRETADQIRLAETNNLAILSRK